MCIEFMWPILTERNCFVLSIFQCCIVWYDIAFCLFIFFQVWQRLPWQRLWSYRKWNSWQWIAFMEVEVKMEQNQKMKSSILMQVSNAVHVSCRGALNTCFCALETKSKIYLKFCALLFCKLCSASVKRKLLHLFLQFSS